MKVFGEDNEQVTESDMMVAVSSPSMLSLLEMEVMFNNNADSAKETKGKKAIKTTDLPALQNRERWKQKTMEEKLFHALNRSISHDFTEAFKQHNVEETRNSNNEQKGARLEESIETWKNLVEDLDSAVIDLHPCFPSHYMIDQLYVDRYIKLLAAQLHFQINDPQTLTKRSLLKAVQFIFWFQNEVHDLVGTRPSIFDNVVDELMYAYVSHTKDTLRSVIDAILTTDYSAEAVEDEQGVIFTDAPADLFSILHQQLDLVIKQYELTGRALLSVALMCADILAYFQAEQSLFLRRFRCKGDTLYVLPKRKAPRGEQGWPHVLLVGDTVAPASKGMFGNDDKDVLEEEEKNKELKDDTYLLAMVNNTHLCQSNLESVQEKLANLVGIDEDAENDGGEPGSQAQRLKEEKTEGGEEEALTPEEQMEAAFEEVDNGFAAEAALCIEVLIAHILSTVREQVNVLFTEAWMEDGSTSTQEIVATLQDFLSDYSATLVKKAHAAQLTKGLLRALLDLYLVRLLNCSDSMENRDIDGRMTDDFNMLKACFSEYASFVYSVEDIDVDFEMLLSLKEILCSDVNFLPIHFPIFIAHFGSFGLKNRPFAPSLNGLGAVELYDKLMTVRSAQITKQQRKKLVAEFEAEYDKTRPKVKKRERKI